MARVRLSGAAIGLAALDLRRAVTALGVRNFAIQLDELSVIDGDTKPGLDRFQICPVPVPRDLSGVREPVREIAHKLDCRRAAAVANTPRRDQLAVGAQGDPRPKIAGFFRRGLRSSSRAESGRAGVGDVW